jgi:hypothetical protein
MSEHMAEPEVKEWRIPLGTTSATTVGERILNLTMFSPNQLFRLFRTDGELIIVAVEGEVWLSRD